MTPMGIGVIGAGTISDTYLENLTKFPDVQVVHVADLDIERAAAQAAKHGVPASGAVPGLLDDPVVDLVVNLTIPAAHVSVGLAAVEAESTCGPKSRWRWTGKARASCWTRPRHGDFVWRARRTRCWGPGCRPRAGHWRPDGSGNR
ncbi:hypothetical protein GCM10029964_072320 [Kibdelosporangium lantanae]